MKTRVNQELCISCGLCVMSCPEVFDWNDAEKARAKSETVPAGEEDCVRKAAGDCPTEAIAIE